MLSKQDQIRYLNRELASVRKFLTGLKSAKAGKKEIHDVRINIKKITALIELNKIRGYEAGNLPMLGIRSLFKITGTIRSSQIILTSLEKSGIDEKKISDYYKEIIRNTTNKLTENIPAQLKVVNAFRIEMSARKLHVLQSKQLLRYHLLKSEFLKKIFKTPIDPNTLHEGRKQIKHILYIRDLMKPAIKKLLPLNFDNLDELQDLIGKWHDSVVYLDFLREFKMEKKQKGMKELIQKNKDQFGQICLFRMDKDHSIFIP